MTVIHNPSTLSDFDFLELAAFDRKVNQEGFEYAATEYPPRFEDAALQATAADYHQLRTLYEQHTAGIDAWHDTMAGVAFDLIDAHNDEADRRARTARLWGIRCTDGFVITCDSREDRDRLVASMRAEGQRPNRRWPAVLLQRVIPGGGWHETRLPV